MSGGRSLSRRDLFKMGGAAAAGAVLLPAAGNLLRPMLAGAVDPEPDLILGGTDGWIWLPPTPSIGGFHPDNLAPDPFNTYVFGFHNLTGLNPQQQLNQKNKAQHSAPMFWTKVGDHGSDGFRVKLFNLGLAQRPDLFDAHTVHWHGFRNVIPFFDGEPTGSIAVPGGRDFTYVYRAKFPGTYMFHCHVEDTEHVQMGMAGIVFIRPARGDKFVYESGDNGFDREFAFILSEVWAEAHWADAHIQLPEWTDYRADFSMLNGRVYPDTIAAHAPMNDLGSAATWRYLHFDHDTDGDLLPPDGRPELQYQPQSSLVTCNSGERVLLRLANLGYKESSMTLAGIRMSQIGQDATPLPAPIDTDTLLLGAGESTEVIFTAPPYIGPGPYDRYMFYNRAFTRSNNLAPGGFGGQATEVWVYPSGVPAQRFPNDYGVTP